MRINNPLNISFHGYKNLIHNDITNGPFKLMFMTMQLDNKDGNDLVELNSIRTLEKNPEKNDVLNVVYSSIRGIREIFLFDGRSMFLGNELKDLYETSGHLKAYKKEEKASLKAYTLLASLTKRIMQNGLIKTDCDYAHVVRNMMESYLKFSDNIGSVHNLIQASIWQNNKPEKTAAAFNKFIVHNMEIFFK